MRNALCTALVEQANRPNFVFLTGDLGYQALEPLRDALGDRFINAGISEQNMVAMAAGLAKQGFEPWCYSIAPFIYARPFEQIRNDAGLSHLPVRLIGNGGGYGYGVMGPTHHAIEDYGVMLSVQNMDVFVPVFSDDLTAIIGRINKKTDGPSYLRLGRSEKPRDYVSPGYKPWRKFVEGRGATAVFVGPLIGGVIDLALKLDMEHRPNIWGISELPLTQTSIPSDFFNDLETSERLYCIEEHVRQGSAGTTLAALLLESGITCKKFVLKCVHGYTKGRYGSQLYHRKSNGIDAETLIAEFISK